MPTMSELFMIKFKVAFIVEVNSYAILKVTRFWNIQLGCFTGIGVTCIKVYFAFSVIRK